MGGCVKKKYPSLCCGGVFFLGSLGGDSDMVRCPLLCAQGLAFFNLMMRALDQKQRLTACQPFCAGIKYGGSGSGSGGGGSHLFV